MEPPTRAGMAEWAVGVVRQLTLTNVLMVALLIIVAVPAYFAWRFMTDSAFRHEFMSSARVIDMHVPCEVVTGNIGGAGSRTTVVGSFAIRDQLEYIIGTRAKMEMSEAQIADACQRVHEHIDMMTKALSESSRQQ